MSNIVGTYRGWAMHFYNLYAAVLGLHDFHGHTGNADGYTRFRNILKVLEDQSVQGLGAIQGQFQPELTIQAA
jgi:hypothetical protein